MTAPFSNPARIIDLHHQGLSHRQIAQQLGCHHRTVQRHLEVNRKAREESERDAVRGWLEEKREETERLGAMRAQLDIPSVIERVERRYGPNWRSLLRQRMQEFSTPPLPPPVQPITEEDRRRDTVLSERVGVGASDTRKPDQGAGTAPGHSLDTLSDNLNENPRSGRWFRRAP